MNGAVMTQAEMVEELMTGLGIKPDESVQDGSRVWVLSDDAVFRLGQACVRQVMSMKADPASAPLALQAAVTRNAWALVDAQHFAGKPASELLALCPHAADDPLSKVWHTAVASRLRWIEGGKVLS